MSAPSHDPEAAHRAELVVVTGRVQGVAFRVWTADRARSLGLSGWVRNEPDGSVTALVSGPSPAVAAMLKLFWEGPPAARVVAVVSELAEDAPPAGFEILD